MYLQLTSQIWAFLLRAPV